MITVWPEYLDKNLSLNEGRKVAKEYCIKNPSINEIETALKRLGYKYSILKENSYPGRWYNHSGRVLVEYENTKLELIREIGLKLKEVRK